MNRPLQLTPPFWAAALSGLALLLVFLPLATQAEDQEDAFEELHEIPRPTTEEVFALLKISFPEAYEELMLAKKEDPVEDFQEALERAEEFVHEYQEIRSEDPQQAQLFLDIERARLRTAKAVERYILSSSSTAKSKTAWNQLLEHAHKVVDLEIRNEEYELAALKREVAEITQLLEEQKQNRRQSAEELLEEFLEDWEDEEDEADDEGEDEDEE